MYKDLVNYEVEIIVSSRVETLLEYNGVLCEESDKFLKLKDGLY